MPSSLLGTKVPSVLPGAQMPHALRGANALGGESDDEKCTSIGDEPSKMPSSLLGAKMPDALPGAKMPTRRTRKERNSHGWQICPA